MNSRQVESERISEPALRQRRKILSLFSFAVVDQALVSGANFVIAFLLIRFTSGADYGLFVIAQSTILLLVAAQSATVCGPMSVLAPQKSPEIRDEMTSTIEVSQRRAMRWLLLAGMIAGLGGHLLGLWGWTVMLIFLATVVAGWTSLGREYFRIVLMIYSRSPDLLRVDAIYVVIVIAGALLAIVAPTSAHINGKLITVPTAVWAVLTLAVAAHVGARISKRLLKAHHERVSNQPDASSQFWREMRPLGFWSAVGAGIFWLFTQSYNYIIASQIGLEAVADVNATRILLMPAILITVGVKGLLIPSASSWFVEFGLAKLVRRLMFFVAGIAVLDLLYIATLWVLRRWLTVGLMHRNVADLDRLILLWGAVALLGLARDVLQTALQALRRLKIVAALTFVGAVVSITIIWVGLKYWGPAATLIGQIVGEVLILIGTIALIAQSSRRAAAIQNPI